MLHKKVTHGLKFAYILLVRRYHTRFLWRKKTYARMQKLEDTKEVFTKTSDKMKLTVVGTGFKGTPAVICLQTREKLYLFNCGDGTEKVMNESLLTNSSKLHHVFITHLSWENVAGIHAKSLMKRISVGHENKITVHGAKEMEELLDFGVMFAEDSAGQNYFEYHDIEDGTYEDIDLSVEYVPLLSTEAIDRSIDIADKKSGYIVRKCHIQKNADQTFGFVCVSKRSEAGIFVGKVTKDSSAELCGLKPGDKIVEVNGINVEQYSHSDVINLIKETDKEVCLLVADEGCTKYCVENNITISSAMQETDMLSLENSYSSVSAKQVIVKHFPVTTSEEDIIQLLGNDIPLKTTILPWKSYKGLTYLYFQSREDAQAAVKRLDGVKYKNSKLEARHAEEDLIKNRDMNRIYLSNLPYAATEKDIENLLMEEFENVRLALDKSSSAPGYNVGNCFIYCKDSQTRARLKKKLHGCVLRGRTLFVDPSNFDEETVSGQMAETVPVKGRPVMAYIVKFKKDNPKFRADLLTELGIKSGPFVKDIIKGKTVERDGKVLTPEMFLEEQEIIRPLVECPSEDYLDSLLASEQFSSLLENQDTVPQMIVHMSSCNIMDDPRYQEFMQRFKSEKTIHLILTGKVTQLADRSSMMYFLSLNQIHGEIFPQLHYDQSVEAENGNIVHGVMNLQYTFKPRSKKGFSWRYVPDLNKESLLKEFWEGVAYKRETMKALEYVHEACKNIEDTSQEKREYPVITFLGTGSCSPTKYRSLSCILVETSKDEYIMLDCAESSVRQLYFMFSEERAEHILRNLRAIFISHLHYDHHGGILSVVRKKKEILSKQNTSERLLLISPAKLMSYFEIMRKHLFDCEQYFRFIPVLFKKAFREPCFDSETTNLIQHVLNVKKFTTIPVDHIYGSFGVHFEHQDGWSLMYSGDTAPCKTLINYGYNKTDYLIHEATFSSSDTRRAAVTRHSTAHQAKEIGRKMKAKHVILTHFSQRYTKNPVFNDMGDVAFAYDFMQLKPKHIPLVTHLKPALALLCKGDNCPENVVYADEQARRFSKTSSWQTLSTCKRNNSDTLEDAPSSKEIRLEDK